MDKPRKVQAEGGLFPAIHSALDLGRPSMSVQSLIDVLTDQICDQVTESLEAVERAIVSKIISRVLNKTGGNQTQAAKLLGVPRTTLISKLKKLKIADHK